MINPEISKYFRHVSKFTHRVLVMKVSKVHSFLKQYFQQTFQANHRFGASTTFFCIKQRLCKHCFKNELTLAFGVLGMTYMMEANNFQGESSER